MNTLTGNPEENIFTLKHWQLIDMGDGISVEGHLYGRPGYPDGLQISSSYINSWFREDDHLYIRTENSTYACALQEYILNSDSLYLLDDVSLEQRTSEIEELRCLYYYEVIKEKGLQNAVIVSWNGCDVPYLNRIVYAANGRLDIDEQASAGFEAVTTLSVSAGNPLSLRCSSRPYSRLMFPNGNDGSEETQLFIENSGTKEIRMTLSGRRRPHRLHPGECIPVKMTFEPVLSMIN